MLDLIIVGGGPAGAAAAVYAARKRLKTVLIVEGWGGQSAVSTDVQNWIGTPSISGAQLSANLRTHVESYADFLTIASPDCAASVSLSGSEVELKTTKGAAYRAKALLIASGATRRKLEVPGAAEYDQKGLTYCASCDGPLFADKDVAVIGGGNAGFETAAQLLAYCKSVTLLNRTDTFRADAITVNAVLSHPNMRVIKNAEPTAVLGSGFVTGLRYRILPNGPQETLAVEGIFVEIGLIPNTVWLGNSVEKNKIGQIVVDPKRQRTSHPRVWAAGDATDGLYHQNNIAAGDAVKAIENIYATFKMS